jgi:subtilisin family serine protease
MRLGKKRLLLSVGLVALIFAGPPGDPAWAMSLGGSRLGGGAGIPIQRGNPGGVVTGNGHLTGGPAIGIVGRGGPGTPCGVSRRSMVRCGPGKIATGGGEGTTGDGPPQRPPVRKPPPPRWNPPPVRVAPILPANPVVTAQPIVPGGGGPGGQGTQAPRRGGSGVPPAGERRYVPDEVVVELAGTATNQQTDALGRRYRLARLQSVPFQLGGTTLVRWRITDRRSVPVVVRALESDATVLSAQPNYLFALQDDTAASKREGDPSQYILGKLHLPEAHALAKGDRVLVAVIDSGIDVTHPDLVGDIAGSFDALGSGLKAHTHGTAIAGAIAAHGRLMGAAPSAQILAIRAFSGEGADEGTTFAIMSGLNWAVTHGARVVNMSFAGPQDPGIARSLAAAHDRGVVLVAAAGNKGAKSPPLYPAADPNVIAVTATDPNDQVPAFANRGRYIAVAAPGVDLMLLAPNASLQLSSGTSFSAAYVSGTAALMLERRPDLGPDPLRQALTGTAHRLAPSPIEQDNQTGAGLVDAYQAVLSLTPAAVDAASPIQVSAPR